MARIVFNSLLNAKRTINNKINGALFIVMPKNICYFRHPKTEAPPAVCYGNSDVKPTIRSLETIEAKARDKLNGKASVPEWTWRWLWFVINCIAVFCVLVESHLQIA